MAINIATCEDCMELMARYPDKWFELAIVDPPYFDGPNKGTFYHGGNSKKKITYKDLQTWDLPNQKWYDELLRVSKNQIIWGINYYNFQPVPCGRNIWFKDNINSSFSDAEIASNSLIKSVKSFKWLWDGFRQENMLLKEIKLHPTQKPVALYRWLLQNYAKPGDKILDTHLGSGSSRIAAYALGFDFWGCEKDYDYWFAAEKRFKNHIAQQRLFIPEKPIIVQEKLF